MINFLYDPLIELDFLRILKFFLGILGYVRIKGLCRPGDDVHIRNRLKN